MSHPIHRVIDELPPDMRAYLAERATRDDGSIDLDHFHAQIKPRSVTDFITYVEACKSNDVLIDDPALGTLWFSEEATNYLRSLPPGSYEDAGANAQYSIVLNIIAFGEDSHSERQQVVSEVEDLAYQAMQSVPGAVAVAGHVLKNGELLETV